MASENFVNVMSLLVQAKVVAEKVGVTGDELHVLAFAVMMAERRGKKVEQFLDHVANDRPTQRLLATAIVMQKELFEENQEDACNVYREATK